MALYADGVNVHALLMQRAEFRKLAEGAVHQSFMHSFLAKSRVLFTHDDTIADLCARLQAIGERDTHLALLEAGTHALPCIYKAHKFFVTRGDLDYTALWILYAATPLAQVEVIAARKLVDREVIPQALALNPGVLQDHLHRPAEHEEDEEGGGGGARGGGRVRGRAVRTRLFAPVLDLPARGRRRPRRQRDRESFHRASSASKA